MFVSLRSCYFGWSLIGLDPELGGCLDESVSDSDPGSLQRCISLFVISRVWLPAFSNHGSFQTPVVCPVLLVVFWKEGAADFR